jgi:hypothetical protein
MVLHCALTEPICTKRKLCHLRHSNKLVRIRYDSETEHSGHFFMSAVCLINSTLQVSKTDHIVWTATFYPIFLEVYVKCAFRTSNKVVGEDGNRIYFSMKVLESSQIKFQEKIPREYIVWWQKEVCVCVCVCVCT